MQYLHALEEKVFARFENEARIRKEMERKNRYRYSKDSRFFNRWTNGNEW